MENSETNIGRGCSMRGNLVVSASFGPGVVDVTLQPNSRVSTTNLNVTGRETIWSSEEERTDESHYLGDELSHYLEGEEGTGPAVVCT